MATGNDAKYLVDAYLAVGGGDVRASALLGVNRAYRRFLSGQHPSSPGATHPWSFLRPMGQIQIPEYITGDCDGSYSSGVTTITADDGAGTFTTGSHPTGDVGVGILVDSVGLMRMTGFPSSPTDGSEMEATGGVADFSSKTFYTGAQIDMPDDFGGLVTNLSYTRDSSEGAGPYLKEVSAELMMRLLQFAPSPSTPDTYALIPMAFTASVGQRYSVVFWPLSDADRVVQFRYRQVPAALTDSSSVYLAGGIDHANTIELAVQADAEFQSRKKAGTYEAAFLEAMMGSISRDSTMFFTEGMARITEG